jgi:hypothetical protein
MALILQKSTNNDLLTDPATADEIHGKGPAGGQRVDPFIFVCWLK